MMKFKFLINQILTALVLFSFLTFSMKAQEARELRQEEGEKKIGQKRIALVIGNGAYTKAKPLPNPSNDADDMAKTLKDLGFEVISGVNQDKRQMETLIREFGTKLSNSGGVGLFYYAGHGLQVAGENYLVPVDADIPEENEVAYAAVSINLVLAKMATANNGLNIIILDACRNNPFARSWRSFRDSGNPDGLAKISPPTGTLVLYATEPGKVASDGAGRNGLFTEALLKQIKQPNVELDAMIKSLARDVAQKSGGKQLPWKEGIVLDDFYFAGITITKPPEKTNETQGIMPKPTPLPTPTPVVASNSVDTEALYWKTVEERNTKSGYELYLTEYPDGRFAKTAKDRITEFNSQEVIKQKNIEQSKWQNAVRENSIEAYNNYLSAYPNGDYAASARQKINEINDEEARRKEAIRKEEDRKKVEFEQAQDQAKWDEVSTLNRKSAYQAYLTAYPNGKYAATAKAKVKEFENEEARVLLEQQKTKDQAAWNEAETLKTIEAYESYLKKNPNGNFASLARLRLSDLGKPALSNAALLANQALDEMMRGNYNEAKRLANEALQLQDDSALALSVRGVARQLDYEFAAARTDLEKAVRLDSSNGIARSFLALVYRGSNEVDLSKATANEALQLLATPKTAIDYSARGTNYNTLEKYDNAISEFNKAIEMNPQLAVLFSNRGWTYLLKGDYDAAIRDSFKAIELNPQYASAYNLRGIAYLNKKNNDAAMSDFTKAIELNPQYAAAYNQRGRVYNVKKDYDAAIRDYSKAIELYPQFTSAYYERGITYINKKDYDSSIRDFSKAIEIYSQFALAYNGRGVAYFYKKDYYAAISDYSKAIEFAPQYALAYENRANAYDAAGQKDLAKVDRQKAKELKKR